MTDLKAELLKALHGSRATMLAKLDGLSEYDRRRPSTPTGTNLLGLVKHLAGMEYGYLGESLGRPPIERPSWFRDDPYAEIDMWATPDESTDYITGVYQQACAHSDLTVAELDLDSPAHVAHWADGHQETTLGALLIRMVAETAQHAGHADIIRELLDDHLTNAEAPWHDRRTEVQKAADPFREPGTNLHTHAQPSPDQDPVRRHDPTVDSEEVLTGGNVAAQVVRVGSTVRKPATAQTSGVEAVLTHLAASGFEGAPHTLGRDDQGRHVLEYVPGTLALTQPPFTLGELNQVGKLIRKLHDAMETFVPPADATWHVLIPDPAHGDLICHNDLAPWNLIRNDDRWVFIDWDNAGPSSRLWDLAYAANAFVLFQPGGNVEVDGQRLRALVDGYDLDADRRRALPAQIAGHTRGMYDLLVRGSRTGEQPWARLHAEGHGDVWGPAADYIKKHHDTWVAALLS